MTATKTLISVAAVVLIAGLGVSYLTVFPQAQAQAQVSRLASECVTYGSGGALQMCIHKFADGTRCVAAGGGGLASVGAGAALQCDFR